RRYIDSLSAYARQFLHVMAKPEVDLLTGLPPTVAIEQRLSRGGRTSTVATVTEVAHYLRLLFAKVGVQHCPQCEQPIRSQTRRQILDRVRRDLGGGRVTVLAPVIRGRKGYHKEILAGARKLRLTEARIDGKRIALASVGLLDRYREHDIDLVVASAIPARGPELEDQLTRALRLGNGSVVVQGDGAERLYSERLFCPACGIGFPPLDPRLFSFNSRRGAGPDWGGGGVQPQPDPESGLAPGRSLADGALLPFEDPERRAEKRRLLQGLRAAGVPLDGPVERLTARQRRLVRDRTVEAVRGALAEDPAGFDAFTVEQPCPGCSGTRLNPRARAVRLHRPGIADLMTLSLAEAAPA